HADTHAIAIAPGGTSTTRTIYEGDDGGIFKSTDSGNTWTSLNNGQFSATQFQSLAVLSSAPNVIVGGTQDNGTNFYGGSWDRADFGDGGFSLIDQNGSATNLTMYHTYFNQTNNLIALARFTGNPSTASQGTWTQLGCGATANGIGCGDTV